MDGQIGWADGMAGVAGYGDALAPNTGRTYTPWNNEEGETIVCCPDGIRPVSFELKAFPNE